MLNPSILVCFGCMKHIKINAKTKREQYMLKSICKHVYRQILCLKSKTWFPSIFGSVMKRYMGGMCAPFFAVYL